MTAAPSLAPTDDLRHLPTVVRDEPGILAVLGRKDAVLAVPEPARALVIAGLAARSSRRPIVVATPATADAERLVNDLEALLGPDAVEHLPAWETLPFERVSPGIETMGRRLHTLHRLGAGRTDPEQLPQVIVTPVRALIQRLAPGVEDIEPVCVRKGDQVDIEALVTRLVEYGYRREYQVEHRGELSVRGSIVDVFPATADRPVRIDLWGDEVDRLTEFSVIDQRTTDDIAVAEILPCRELLPTEQVRERAEKLIAREPWGREHWERLAEGQLFDGMESWLPWLSPDERVLADLLPDDAQILLVEPRRMRDRAADFLAEEADLAQTLAKTWGAVSDGEAHDFPPLHLPFERVLSHTTAATWHLTSTPEGPDSPIVQAMTFQVTAGDEERRRAQLRDLRDSGYRIVVAADGEGSAARMRELLSDAGVGGEIVVQPVERGCILPGVRLALLAEADLTGRRRSHRKARPRRRDAQKFFDDLQVGDHVVHHQHGVARYGGMVKRAIGGVERDYLLLEYRDGDKLYVPSDQIDAVRHYTGGDTPSLTRLGGDSWSKAKARVRSAVTEIAQELVVLYQKRLAAGGHAYGADTPWQRQFEEAFPYEPTPDQLKAVDDIKGDMEAEAAMDRLVVGDVGFGKTEVAIRAAFKAVQDGKQVAVLVPTTLLAQQHFQTFSERFAEYPVRVEVLSRFLTPGQAKSVVEGLRTGAVDIVVGTHRLLNKEISFHDLGLLVVDEEQRVGVKHKERIKELKANVDVLTLTATPIPRTLEMSLTGIRDMSLLETPPADRQPILTYVGEFDERAVAEAIRRELLREGQVFYVHNRVRDIDQKAQELRELVPEARIAVAHGQMDEGSLEQVVIDFWEGRFDVLVCTTIIESGIDMPTVNTLVVERADLLGLGQLHQIRGRVGRSGSRAYAYLFHPQDMVLSEEAYERLRTIGESTELGSGFKIAMRDLEIRGAGNLLGTGQSGHIAAVGYDLYCQMVTEAVAELKGEPVREPAEVKIETLEDAHLPPDYVEREELRLEAYRRLAAVTSDAEVDDIAREWEDRYGPIPEAAKNLLQVARLRAECHRVGVTEVTVVTGDGFMGPAYKARVSPVHLKTSQTVRLKRIAPKAVHKPDSGLLEVPMAKGSDPTVDLVTFLRHLLPPEQSGSSADAPAS
ncbi:MAG TPA: transcription-repair coupling factor [Acidimicrobiales bacterium]|nr:transcription-repair coupling factor [Acidimicrobiales bacterium]